MNTQPIFVANVTAAGTTWTNADAAATTKVITPLVGENGARIHQIAVTNTDTVNIDISIYANDGSTDFLLGTLQIPANSGATSAVPAKALPLQTGNFPWFSADGSILLPAGWSLKASNAVQVASAKVLTIVAWGGDY